MIAATDTNILLDILIPDDEFCGASAEALEKAVSVARSQSATLRMQSSAFILRNSGIAMPFWMPTKSAFTL